ncbi:hypothetical protein Tco_0754183 [Tanacetum coccineum]
MLTGGSTENRTIDLLAATKRMLKITFKRKQNPLHVKPEVISKLKSPTKHAPKPKVKSKLKSPAKAKPSPPPRNPILRSAKHAPPSANPKPKAPKLKASDVTEFDQRDGSGSEEGDGSGSEEEGDVEEDEKEGDDEEDEEEGDEEEDEKEGDDEEDEEEGDEEEDEEEEEEEKVSEEEEEEDVKVKGNKRGRKGKGEVMMSKGKKIKVEDKEVGEKKRKKDSEPSSSEDELFSLFITAKNHVDYRVFMMLHMESYIGDPIAKWDVGLCEESEEQVSLLRRMRFKISTKILLHKFNVHAENMFDLAYKRMVVCCECSRMEEVAGRGGRRKKVAGRGGRRKKVTGKGGRHEEGVWSVEPDLFRSGGRQWKKVEEESPEKVCWEDESPVETGFLYLSVVSQLASVVTVLENVNVFKAMKKGKNLLYGKKVVGMVIGFVMYVILVGMMIVLELFVGYRYGDTLFGIHIIKRVMIGISCGLVLLVWFLLFIVIQTVLYLVCKSFHREAIDKLSISTFLGAYNGETIVLPNSGEEIQLGRTQVSV